MEEDERVQKLKAGKEKLAQFQKKKKKKKRPSQHAVAPEVLDVQIGEDMEISSALGMSAGAAPLYDSDQQSASTCSEDETSTEETTGKGYVQVKFQLQEKSRRVEELEESLVGKQLALDKVIAENQQLRKHDNHKGDDRKAPVNGLDESSEPKMPVPGNQPSHAQARSPDQPAEDSGSQQAGEAGGSQPPQQFEAADVQELLQHVQWLQLHLKQANGTMHAQNERQKSTVAALTQARQEIFALKDNIDCKDQILSQLAGKLTQLSTQHEALKHTHQELIKDKSESEDRGVDMEKEIGRIKAMLQDEYESRIEKVKSDSDERVKAVTEKIEAEFNKHADEMKIRLDQLETEKEELCSSKDVLAQQLDHLTTEAEDVKLKNESLMEDIETMKNESESKLNEVLTEKDELQANIEALIQERDGLQVQCQGQTALTVRIEELNSEKHEVAESFEEMKNENSSLLTENQELIDELAKLKEDNNMYRKQLTEREDEISENGEIMEENVSLRMQNDELYNKINNQKDLIASLKGELELLTCENFQLVGQVKEHSVDEEKYKNDIDELLKEKETLKSQLDVINADNTEHKDKITELESQVSLLKSSLTVEEPSKPDKSGMTVQHADTSEVSDDVFPETVRMTMKPVEEHLVMPEAFVPAAEAFSAVNIEHELEPVPNLCDTVSDEHQLVLESQIVEHILEQLNEVQETPVHAVIADSVEAENSDMSFIHSAKTSSDDANAKIHALQQEVLKLTNELDELRNTSTVSNDSTVLVTTSPQDNDVNSDVNSDNLSDESSSAHCTANNLQDDTAYHSSSEQSDMQTVPEVNSVALQEQIVMLQREVDKANALLSEKQDECDRVNAELNDIKQGTCESDGVLQPGTALETLPSAPAASSEQLPVQQEVSDIVIPSLPTPTSELEVNLHASSTPSLHGTFSPQTNLVVGDIVSGTVDQIVCSETNVLDSPPEPECVEDEETTCSHDMRDTDHHLEEESSVEQKNKLKKDRENQNRINDNLQQEIQSVNKSLQRSKDMCDALGHENEKLKWERDEFELKVQGLENELGEMKTLICDKEFREEDYSTVKERLEYLESSATDCFEMNKMLEVIQEEKDNILKENESLQCSLSAKFIENEQLLKRLETMNKENHVLVREIEETRSECSEMKDKVNILEKERSEAATELSSVTKSSAETETRLLSEVEGLLEENSTLKTRTQSLQAEVETLNDENDRLNSFFPNIDEKSAETERVALQLIESESKFNEVSKENENLVKDLMAQEQKLADSIEENKSVWVKCDELQQIIEEMDDEKTELLNNIQLSEETNKQMTQEHTAVIEKLEMQLGGLDEENSTLKTQVLSLGQDKDDITEIQVKQDETISKFETEIEALKQENSELSEKVISLEQESLSLVEQTKHYEQSKPDFSASLQNDLEKVIEEKRSIEERCADLANEKDRLKDNVDLLTEQLNAFDAKAPKSQEVQRLCERLELETKSKKKLQDDLEKYQQLIAVLEKDKLKMSDELSVSLKEVTGLTATKLEDEKLIGDLSKELETARNEKDEFVVEMKIMDSEYQTVTERNIQLSQEVEMLQGHLQAVSENRNHIRTQTEILVSELDVLSTSRDSLSTYIGKIRQQNNDLNIENQELKAEFERVEKEKEELENQSPVMQSDAELPSEQDASIRNSGDDSERESNIEQQCTNLEKIVDNLKKQLGVTEEEKLALENLTEDLTNMLRDMQTKYEEVKSEMESTKKNCDKEISHLQTQLQVMNDDVLQLRKMLDVMENEVYHAAEEKVVLKENLEQQQAQYVEAVEQKQILEDILSDKSQKDRKNLEMASRVNQVNNDSVSPETGHSIDSHVEEQSDTESIASADNNSPNTETVLASRETELISHLSAEHVNVPSVESALHFMDLQSHDTKLVHSSVQTNISGDSVGLTTSNESDKCLCTSATQTEDLHHEINPESSNLEIDIEQTDHPSNQDHVSNTETGESLENQPPHTSDPAIESNSEIIPETCSSIERERSPSLKIVVSPDESNESAKELSHDPEREVDCSLLEETAAANVLYDSGVISPGALFEALGDKNCMSDPKTESELFPSQGEPEQTAAASESVKNTNSDNNTDTMSVTDQQKIEEDIENKVLKKFEFRERMIKAQEDSYEKKVKQMHYDIEEEYEFKFRRREAAIMVDTEQEKKAHARDVEHAAELKIEKIKKEKDEQFVATLQKVRDDLARRHGGRSLRSRELRPGPDGDGDGEPASSESPDGDGDQHVKQLRRDNEDLASARDALLQKLDLTQQEQTAFQENLLYIMGDDDLTCKSPRLITHPPGSTPLAQHARTQKMPAWLDWDVVPDMSFDSVTSRSTIDAKSLSGSLDPASFCSSSDCLSVRMKYEQLIEKIQQYLKIQPPADEQETGEGSFSEVCDSVPDEFDGAEVVKDRFVESNEPDSQVLQRITSVHLEHFVREPSEHKGDMPDQFVHEPDSPEKEFESNEGILEALVEESKSRANNKSPQVRFTDRSDGKGSNRESPIEQKTAGCFVPFEQDKNCDESAQGHFREDDSTDISEISMAKLRRHFSESDIKADKDTGKAYKTFQSDNAEGHFVIERSPTGSRSDPDRDSSDDKGDDVFEEIPRKSDVKKMQASPKKNSKRKKGTKKGKPPQELKLSSNSFVAERSKIEDTTPGSEAMLFPSDNLRKPLTGEDRGDFFEENVVRHVQRSLQSENSDKPSFFSDSIVIERQIQSSDDEDGVESGDILESIRREIITQESLSGTASPITASEDKSNTSDISDADTSLTAQDLRGVKDANETTSNDLSAGPREGDETVPNQEVASDLSREQQPAYLAGKQSYENAVFDILNSICPGTDPSRIRGAFRPAEDQFQAVAGEFSDTPQEAVVQDLGAQIKTLHSQLSEAQTEKGKLEQALLEKEQLEKTLAEKEASLSELNKAQEKYQDLLKETEELRMTNQQLGTDFQAQVETLQTEKAEIENALLSQAEMYDKLVEEKKVMDEQLSLRSNELEQEIVTLTNKNKEFAEQIADENRFRSEMLSKEKKLNDDLCTLKEDNIELNKRVQDFMKTVDSCNDTLKDKESEINSIMEEKQAQLVKLDTMQNTLDDLNKRVEELTETSATLEEENITSKAKCDEQNAVLRDKLTELEKAMQEKISAQTELHRLVEEGTHLKYTIAKISNQIAGNPSESDGSVPQDGMEHQPKKDEKLHDQRDTPEVCKTLEEMAEKILCVKQVNYELKNEIDTSKSLKEALEKDLAEMKKRNAENEWAIKELGNQVESLEQEKQILQTEHSKMIENNQVQHETMNTDIVLKTEQLQQIQEEKSDFSKRVQELTETISQLEEENKSLSCNLRGSQEHQAETKILEEDLQTEKSQSQQLKEEIEKLKDQLEHLEKEKQSIEIETVNETAAENECSMKELQKQIETIEEEKQSLQIENKKTLEDTQTYLETLKAEIDLQKGEIEKLQDEKSCVSSKVQELREKILQLEEENLILSYRLKESKEHQSEKQVLEEDLQREKEQTQEHKVKIKKLEDYIEKLETDEQLSEKKTKSGNQAVEPCENLEIEMLQAENAALKSRLESVEVNSDTENDCQILQELREALRLLQEEKIELEKNTCQQRETLEKDNKCLSNEIEKLQDEIDAIKKTATAQEETLKKENTDVLKMYSDLRNEVEILVISKHDLEVELHVLKDLLEQETEGEHAHHAHHAHAASRDTSRELTAQDLEEMEQLKTSIEKLKSDLKEKDDYVRKLEEHLLNINQGLPAIQKSSPKPLLRTGESAHSKKYTRKRSYLLQYGRRAFSHDLSSDMSERSKGHPAMSVSRTDTTSEDWSLEQSLSENQFVAGVHEEPEFKSSINSESTATSSTVESFEAPEKVQSEKENGHLALERKQFELVDEITTLRRDFRETKAIYAQEAALLTEALEKEKTKKDLLEAGRDRSRSGSGCLSAIEAIKLRQDYAVLKEENKMLKIENDRWLLRMKEQEKIVLDLRDRLSRNTSGIEEIEEVFGRQLALLQKQREELVDQLKDRDMEYGKLSTTLGEKGVIEETLRREKEELLTKLQEKTEVEQELNDFKIHFEKQITKRKQMEEIINQKDQNEIQLMRQKRMLEEELHGIESKFRDKEETLETEKHRLLDEIRETRSVRISTYVEEDDNETRSVTLDGSILVGRNIEKLESMLEEVERQHSSAVKILRDQLKWKHSRREQMLKAEHAEGLKKLKDSTDDQVS